MKTALYCEEGVLQLVITPETDFEKEAIERFRNQPIQAKIMAGSFYDCRGGWIRQSGYYSEGLYGNTSAEDKSLIVRLDDNRPADHV